MKSPQSTRPPIPQFNPIISHPPPFPKLLFKRLAACDEKPIVTRNIEPTISAKKVCMLVNPRTPDMLFPSLMS